MCACMEDKVLVEEYWRFLLPVRWKLDCPRLFQWF